MAKDTREAAAAAIEQALAIQNVPPPKIEPELIGKVPVKKTNGPLPRETVERGLAHFDVLEAECEALKRELAAAREEIHLLKIHINELEGTRGTIESRINQCVLERDNAVREAGELHGVLNSIASICVRYHNAQHDQE